MENKYYYFVSYKYQRSREEIKVGVKKLLTWVSHSSDKMELDFQVETMEDIYKLEKTIFDVLKPECELREQKIDSLLLLGVLPLKN